MKELLMAVHKKVSTFNHHKLSLLWNIIKTPPLGKNLPLWYANKKDSSKPNNMYNLFYRNSEKELLEPIAGKASGNFPKWIEGTFIQNGPGKFKYGNSSVRHWFDGAAYLQKFNIKNGNVTYQTKFLESSTYKKNMAAKRVAVAEFGTAAEPDPCETIFKRYFTMFSSIKTDNCTVSLYPVSENICAFTETPVMHAINTDNLSTKKKFDISHRSNLITQTAHPHILLNGDAYNVGLSMTNSGIAYNIFEIPNKKEGNGFDNINIKASVPSSLNWQPGYMHSFGITKNYYILLEQPLSISMRSVLTSSMTRRPFIESFRWRDVPVKFHVINRESKEKTSYVADTFFFFHTINQYEKDGHIVMDVCCYKDASVINKTLFDVIKSDGTQMFEDAFAALPLRFVIPLNTDGSGNLVTLENTEATAIKEKQGVISLRPETLSPHSCELPRFNYNYLGKEYRYFYGISFGAEFSSGKIIKVDTETKKSLIWSEEGAAVNEPVFLQSPYSKSEDDGILLISLLYFNDPTKIALVALDSVTLTEVGRTEFCTPGPVPKAIHGWFT